MRSILSNNMRPLVGGSKTIALRNGANATYIALLEALHNHVIGTTYSAMPGGKSLTGEQVLLRFFQPWFRESGSDRAIL